MFELQQSVLFLSFPVQSPPFFFSIVDIENVTTNPEVIEREKSSQYNIYLPRVIEQEGKKSKPKQDAI